MDRETEHRFLNFDGSFESGNIDLVIKTYPQESYDIYLRPDSNTRGYFQWFYFKVNNKLKGTKAKFNIVNLTKRNSLYQQGMPIQVLSMKRASDQGTTWAFGGDNVKYGLSKLNKFVKYEETQRKRTYFQLGWEYTFEYDDDSVYFAFSIPYTFSMINKITS